MNLYSLIKRSLWHYRRTHIGVLLGTAIGTGVLTGALMIGDAVQESLEQRVTERIGNATFAFVTGESFTSATLARRITQHTNVTASALISLPGNVTTPDNAARANQIMIHGIDNDFFALSPAPSQQTAPGPNHVALNQRLAEQLGITVGDRVILRVDTPGAINRDLPVGSPNASATALRLQVSQVLPPNDFGRFSLRAEQTIPMNAFVDRDILAKAINAAGRANLILVGNRDPTLSTENLTAAIKTVWTGDDAGLSIKHLPHGNLELLSRRLFIEQQLLNAAKTAAPDANAVLTYFVNAINANKHSTPYSFVAGIAQSPLTDGIPDDAIVVNQWLADDLMLKPNDTVKLRYTTITTDNQLTETNHTFNVHHIVPLEDDAHDQNLMPEFPGLSDVDNCQDWNSGLPIDLNLIREKDEAYWDAYRGTPKAFVTIAAAQSMWSNRYGIATAVRFPAQDKSPDILLKNILSHLRPGDVGLRVLPIRDSGNRASREGVSFGQLFLGLSFFLIVSALLLTSLLFVFGVEQRTEETGILLAIGFTPRQVRQFRMIEGGCLALPGAALGIGVGIICNALVLHLLSGSWQTIVGTVSLQMRILPATCMTGFTCGALTAWFAMWLAGRKQLSHPPAELQRSPGENIEPLRLPMWSTLLTGFICLAAVIAIVIAIDTSGGGSVAGIFFTAGGLTLAGFISFSHTALAWLGIRHTAGTSSIAETGLRACARHPRYSLTIITILAACTFIIIATGANRPGSPTNLHDSHSGSGGFELFAESAIPIHENLQSSRGRKTLGIREDLDIHVVPMRVFEGDDASCLNLNHVTTPPILGVNPLNLSGRFTVTATATESAAETGWGALSVPETESVPAIADQAVILWGLGLSVGNILTIQDDWGKPLNLRLVAGTANSILQGHVLISEENFISHFSGNSGYRTFLIDVQSGEATMVAKELSYALRDYGFEVTSSATRLATFASIQDTYLSIFMMLGALGLLLGSIGMGIIVARNVMTRRGEIAMLSALGFKRSAIWRLLYIEHTTLFGVGILAGVTSGLIAVLPALHSQGTPVSLIALGILVTGLLLNGILWITVSLNVTMRTPLISALRQE